jgi:hypothetical protein
MYDLNTPIEDLPTSIEIVGHCATVRTLEGEENRYNLFDLDSWSFIFNGNVGVFSQDDDYTKGRHLCLVEDRETMLSNFYNTDRKEFILKSAIPSKKLTEFGQSEMVEDTPVAVLRSEDDRRVNFISPDGEFLFGPDENTWPLYADDEKYNIEPLSALMFRDGYAIANLYEFKLISNEHFEDIEALGDEDRYFELIRQDGSKIIYDYKEDTFVRSNLDAENHFEGYDGTSLIDYLGKNFDKIDNFIPGQVYKVGKYTVGQSRLRQNLVTVSNSGKPVLILPEWFDYIMPFGKTSSNHELIRCSNRGYSGSKIFNLGTMEFVTDRYVIIVSYRMGGMAIQDTKDSTCNLINSNGKLVFNNFILEDVDDIGRYPHTTERFLKITNMEGDYNVYDFKDNKLMLNNWAASVYLIDGPNETYKNYFIVKAINNTYYAVREDGTELFTDLNARDMYTYGGNSVKITTSNGDIVIGNLETGKVYQDVRVSTESRKRSGKIIRINNDKLNKLFIY